MMTSLDHFWLDWVVTAESVLSGSGAKFMLLYKFCLLWTPGIFTGSNLFLFVDLAHLKWNCMVKNFPPSKLQHFFYQHPGVFNFFVEPQDAIFHFFAKFGSVTF